MFLELRKNYAGNFLLNRHIKEKARRLFLGRARVGERKNKEKPPNSKTKTGGRGKTSGNLAQPKNGKKKDKVTREL